MFNVEKRNCMSNFKVKLDRARQAVNEIQDCNSKDFQEAEQLIVELKQAIRNDLMPQTEQEDKRLKDIASKLNTHIKTGFENFHTPQDISHYLESAFQRGKKDKTYGRALILIEENEMIELLTPSILRSKEGPSWGLCKPHAGQLEEQAETL